MSLSAQPLALMQMQIETLLERTATKNRLPFLRPIDWFNHFNCRLFVIHQRLAYTKQFLIKTYS